MYLKYAILPVADIDRAIAFYTGRLRLVVTTDLASEDGTRRVELAFPTGGPCLLLEPRGADEARPAPALVLTVPDVDMAFERLAALGVMFVTPPMEHAGGRRAAFRDSEDNLVLLERDRSS